MYLLLLRRIGLYIENRGAIYIQGSRREINQDPPFKLVQILQILRTTQASNKNLYIIILALTRINVLLIN
jgi:hypothetical protein